MKVKRYSRVRMGGDAFQILLAGDNDFEEGSLFFEGRVGGYTRVGRVVTIHVGRRMLLREKRASRARRMRAGK